MATIHNRQHDRRAMGTDGTDENAGALGIWREPAALRGVARLSNSANSPS